MLRRQVLLLVLCGIGLISVSTRESTAWPRLLHSRRVSPSYRQRTATDLSIFATPEAERLLLQLRVRLPGKTDDEIIQVIRGYATCQKSADSDGMNWFNARVEQARKQKQAFEAIVKEVALVRYDYQVDPLGDWNWDDGPEPPGPAWLRELVGVDLLSDIVVVFSAGRDHLRYLPQFGHLRELFINGPMNDADLEVLHDLKELKKLDIYHLEVSKESMQKFRAALPNCKVEWHCGGPT